MKKWIFSAGLLLSASAFGFVDGHSQVGVRHYVGSGAWKDIGGAVKGLTTTTLTIRQTHPGFANVVDKFTLGDKQFTLNFSVVQTNVPGLFDVVVNRHSVGRGGCVVNPRGERLCQLNFLSNGISVKTTLRAAPGKKLERSGVVMDKSGRKMFFEEALESASLGAKPQAVAKPQQEPSKPQQEPSKPQQGKPQGPAKPQQEPSKPQQEPSKPQQEPSKPQQGKPQGPAIPQSKPQAVAPEQGAQGAQAVAPEQGAQGAQATHEVQGQQAVAQEVKPQQGATQEVQGAQVTQEVQGQQAVAQEVKPQQGATQEVQGAQVTQEVQGQQAVAQEAKPEQGATQEVQGQQEATQEVKPQAPMQEAKPSAKPAQEAKPSAKPSQEAKPASKK